MSLDPRVADVVARYRNVQERDKENKLLRWMPEQLGMNVDNVNYFSVVLYSSVTSPPLESVPTPISSNIR